MFLLVGVAMQERFFAELAFCVKMYVLKITN
jgi:hypothetical protein